MGFKSVLTMNSKVEGDENKKYATEEGALLSHAGSNLDKNLDTPNKVLPRRSVSHMSSSLQTTETRSLPPPTSGPSITHASTIAAPMEPEPRKTEESGIPVLQDVCIIRYYQSCSANNGHLHRRKNLSRSHHRSK